MNTTLLLLGSNIVLLLLYMSQRKSTKLEKQARVGEQIRADNAENQITRYNEALKLNGEENAQAAIESDDDVANHFTSGMLDHSDDALGR